MLFFNYWLTNDRFILQLCRYRANINNIVMGILQIY